MSEGAPAVKGGRASRGPWTPSFPWITGRLAALATAIAFVYALSALYPPLATVALALGTALAGVGIADALIGPRRRDITIAREPLEHLSLRRTTTLRYRVVNRSAAAIRYQLVDTPVSLLRIPEAPASGMVGPRRQAIAQIEALPVERGDARLGRIYASIETPLGLIRRRWIVDAAMDVRVFPDLSAVERYGMLARQGRLIEAGFRKLRLRGGGGEFDSLREYVPDDAFRAIDWKATARRAKLMVAQYDVERSQHVMLVLDAGRLMTPRIGDQRKFDYAVTAALSVASIASLADDKVGLLAFARDVIEHIPPRSGLRHANGLTQRIYDVQPRFEESDYEGAFAYLRRRQPKRSLVVVFTDMFDPVASATVLGHLSMLSPRHLVVCVLMNDEAIESAVSADAPDVHDAYRASVAFSLLAERRKAAAMLATRGVAVIDVPASALTTSLINAYVEIKSRALI